MLALLITLVQRDGDIVLAQNIRRIGIQPDDLPVLFEFIIQSVGLLLQFFQHTLCRVVDAGIDFRLILAEILDNMLVIGKWMERMRQIALGGNAQRFALQSEGTAGYMLGGKLLIQHIFHL